MGKKKFMDRRKYTEKLFEKELIRNRGLGKEGVHDVVIVLDHLKPSFNIGKIFRSAEAFGANSIHLVGINFFDPIPSKGCFRKVKAHFHETFDDCYKSLLESGYTLLGLDSNTEDYLQDIEIPKKAAFILGHEEYGLSFDLLDYPEIKRLKIRQFGVTESLNVAIAATVSMYEYTRVHGADR
ncbi:MAG: tRNA (guanine-N2)-dimethyltransferase [Halobacteriovorax sp.]|nr:tRNA (guanine-N2)-dimethyltransferase [Halobacteriovorax sp.]|tara:strand:+ start:72655 stop:73200 length:546 start_codon:yes stop_codon:yes gene_type:complete